MSSVNEIIKAMSELDDIKEEISDGTYLTLANSLKINRDHIIIERANNARNALRVRMFEELNMHRITLERRSDLLDARELLLESQRATLVRKEDELRKKEYELIKKEYEIKNAIDEQISILNKIKAETKKTDFKIDLNKFKFI
jgi:hypothetical protein